MSDWSVGGTWVEVVTTTAAVAGFVARYWFVALALLLCWVTFGNGFRSERRVLPLRSGTAGGFRRLSSLARSDLSTHLLAVVVGVVAAAGLLNSLDRGLQDEIRVDADKVVDDLERRASVRLYHRCRELTERLYLRNRKSDKRDSLPEWARWDLEEYRGAPARLGPDGSPLPLVAPEHNIATLDSPWPAPADRSIKDGDLIWRAFLKALASDTRADTIGLIRKAVDYRKTTKEESKGPAPLPVSPTPRPAEKTPAKAPPVPAPAGKGKASGPKVDPMAKAGPTDKKGDPAPELPTETPLDVLSEHLGVKITPESADNALGVLTKLLIDPGNRFDDADLRDFELLFEVDDTGRHLKLRQEVAEALKTGWPGTADPLRRAIVGRYAADMPPLDDPSPEVRARATADLWDRLGKLYEPPAATRVAGDLADAARASLPPKTPQARRDNFAYMLLVLAVAPSEDTARIDAVSPEKYDLGGLTLRKAVTSRLITAVDQSIVRAIESGGRKERPFTLQVTFIRFRSIIRGPIQFITMCVFLAGMTLLVIKGYVHGVWAQLSYLPFVSSPYRDPPDPYDARWRDLWSGQRKASPGDPVTRQVVGSRMTAKDLLPRMFQAGFGSIAAGHAPAAAADAADEAADDWVAGQEREQVFLDYLEYLLPALGFVGTLIGNGQGLGVANQVVLPDPETQAESISSMTTHLGMAFYATLVSLVCAIVYLFFRAGSSRLQSAVVRACKLKVRAYLLAHVAPPAPPDAGLATASAPPVAVPDATLVPPQPANVAVVSTAAALFLRLGKGDVFAGYPPDGVPPFGPQASGDLLADLLSAHGLLTPVQWRDAATGPLAFTVIPALLVELPSHLREFAWLLYFWDLRPARAALAKYGLRPPAKAGEPTLPAPPPDADRFDPVMSRMIRRWGHAWFEGLNREKWNELAGRLGSSGPRTGLLTADPTVQRSLNWVEEGNSPPVRLLRAFAVSLDADSSPRLVQSLAAASAQPKLAVDEKADGNDGDEKEGLGVAASSTPKPVGETPEQGKPEHPAPSENGDRLARGPGPIRDNKRRRRKKK